MSHIFVSYSRVDKSYVEALVRYLREKQFTVWWDDRIETGSNWQVELAMAIKTAACVVLIMSESAQQSEWVQNEIKFAKTHNIAILPLLLNGKVFPDLETTHYTLLQDGQLPPERFESELRNKAIAVPYNSNHFISELVKTLKAEKGFVDAHISDNPSSIQSAYTGIRKRSWSGDINAIRLIRADHLSLAQIKAVHDDYFTYVNAWKPSFFLERAIKKRGVLGFVFDKPVSQETIQFARELVRDSEQKGLALYDGVRTVSWAISLDLERVEGQTGLLAINQPAIADYHPGKKWIEQLIQKYMRDYEATKSNLRDYDWTDRDSDEMK